MELIVTIFAFILAAYLVFAWVQTMTPSDRLFHKRKIVEVTHSDGTVDYTVKVNGLMGMPFLYHTETDYSGSGDTKLEGMSFGHASMYVYRKERQYRKNIGIRVARKRTVYP